MTARLRSIAVEVLSDGAHAATVAVDDPQRPSLRVTESLRIEGHDHDGAARTAVSHGQRLALAVGAGIAAQGVPSAVYPEPWGEGDDAA